MLNGARPFTARPSSPAAPPAPVGLRTALAELRHFRQARQFVVAAPIVHVHVGAALPSTTGERIAGALHWAVLDGPKTVAVVQQHRGVCWAVDPRRRDDPRIVAAVGELAARQVRFSDTIFGPEHEVAAVAEVCRRAGVETVELRPQEMMACPAPRPLAAAAGGFVLRSAARRDMDWLLAAHGAMCLEDLGVDQVSRNPEGYAHYFEGLARLRRIVVGEMGGRPVFKAEIALESREAWLIEGVYTWPSARGRGCASRAMLWLAEMARRCGRVACLYVNQCNDGAIRVYRRVGFETVSPWATALLMRNGRRPGPSS